MVVGRRYDDERHTDRYLPVVKCGGKPKLRLGRREGRRKDESNPLLLTTGDQAPVRRR